MPWHTCVTVAALTTALHYTPLLWFLPAALFTNAIMRLLVGGVCFWFMWRVVHLVYLDIEHRYGFLLGLAAAALVFSTPPLAIVWYYLFPHRDVHRPDVRDHQTEGVSPVWEAETVGRWMDRQGWERARDSLHVEQDLLASKSKAAIAANLEREMKHLPLPKRGESEETPVTEEREEAPPWESLGLANPETLPDDPDRPPLPVTVVQVQQTKYTPPQIDGVSDYTLNRLFSVGKFDEVIAYLANRLRAARDRGSETGPIEDYLRIARAQQLHRELERYRLQYDREALLTPDHREQTAAE